MSFRERIADRRNSYAFALNSKAWWGVHDDPSSDLLDFRSASLEAMLADELSDHGSDAILDTLALAYHRTRHTARAIENQKKAHALLPTGSEYRTAFERQLATFEKALKDARQDLPPE